jgi:hypothetical protein
MTKEECRNIAEDNNRSWLWVTEDVSEQFKKILGQ